MFPLRLFLVSTPELLQALPPLQVEVLGCSSTSKTAAGHRAWGREVLGAQRKTVERIVHRHKAPRVRVFGWVARSAAGRLSDVDLLVDFLPEASAYERVELILDLEKLLRRKVDVTTESALHWLVGPQALFEAVAL
jgi:uncharacterized protein